MPAKNLPECLNPNANSHPIYHLTAHQHPEHFYWNQQLQPPVETLYATGNPDLLKPSLKLGIVGSRIISSYGIKVLEQIVPKLVKAGITIVSGGAFGVDYNSQSIALRYNGQVITVLASGIENPTPKTNLDFFHQVRSKGLLISESAGQVPAQKFSFVRRNRVIAGLSDILLIVEARQKSGALITADYAIDLGKTVACFPGRAFDFLSKGTNALLKQGAELVTSAEEILELFDQLNSTRNRK